MTEPAQPQSTAETQPVADPKRAPKLLTTSLPSQPKTAKEHVVGNPNIAEAGREYRFKPGESGNKHGRPKGFAAYCRSRTQDGKKVVDFFMRVLADPKAKTSDKAEAAKFLAAYAFGKPVETHDVNMDITNWVERFKPYLDPTKRQELAQVLSRIADGRS
jgi:hypothetical protein